MKWRALSVALAAAAVLMACGADGLPIDDGGGSGPTSGPGNGPGPGSGGSTGSVCGHQGAPESAVAQGVTAAHNAARCGVNTPTALPPLQWNDAVAGVAQAYADQLAAGACDLVHSGGPYGENLFWGSAAYTAQEVVDAWMSEEPCYDPASGQCGTTCVCGHYTQIVWRETTQLGCGVGNCAGGGQIWVCNYDPPGNFIGQKAF